VIDLTRSDSEERARMTMRSYEATKRVDGQETLEFDLNNY